MEPDPARRAGKRVPGAPEETLARRAPEGAIQAREFGRNSPNSRKRPRWGRPRELVALDGGAVVGCAPLRPGGPQVPAADRPTAGTWNGTTPEEPGVVP